MFIQRVTFSIFVLLLASPAYGRKGHREGFNFGTSLRLMGGDGTTYGQNSSEHPSNDSKLSSTSQSVSPFIGYAFQEFLNIGAILYFEQGKSNSVDKTLDGSVETLREQDSSINGAGLFARFLFAKVMFFEGSFGAYEQTLSTTTETRNVNGSSINGTRTENQVHGIGPGYHVGGGLELPVVNNFYFTATYLIRSFQQRDYNAASQIVGRKQAVQEKRELTFGLVHYYQ